MTVRSCPIGAALRITCSREALQKATIITRLYREPLPDRERVLSLDHPNPLAIQERIAYLEQPIANEA